WDEANMLCGRDPDFNRRDMFESIERGDFFEYELGLQVVEESDELAFGFDLLDATKLLPEELVPVRRVGRLTLNRNPDNFFAETEQVVFHSRPPGPGDRLHRRPAAAGAAALVHRRAADPAWRPELPRDPDQSARGARAQQ